MKSQNYTAAEKHFIKKQTEYTQQIKELNSAKDALLEEIKECKKLLDIKNVEIDKLNKTIKNMIPYLKEDAKDIDFNNPPKTSLQLAADIINICDKYGVIGHNGVKTILY